MALVSRLVHRNVCKTLSPLTRNFARQISSGNNDHNQEEGEWLHKLNMHEETYLEAHRKGLRQFTSIYHLSSRKPIPPELVYEALNILQRKAPNYQLVVRERDGERWFRKANITDIDFKMRDKGTPKVDLAHEPCFPFDDANGPFWRVRMAEATDDNPDKIPELKDEYPYLYYLALCPHHAIHDGTTCILVFPWLFGIINTLLKGEEYTDMSPIGEFLPNVEYDQLFSKCKEELLKNPERVESLKQELLREDKSPTLLKGFPRPLQVDKPTTGHVYVDIEKDIMTKFLQKCKANKVTAGNALQTVINTALIELVQDAGVYEEEYDISTMYVIGTRRYMKKRKLPVVGHHVRGTSSMVTLGKNVRDDFFGNCIKIQETNKHLIDDISLVEKDVMRQVFLPLVPPKEMFNSPIKMVRDYGYNNVGSFGLVGRGENVMMSGAENYFQVSQLPHPLYNQVFSYEGNFRNMLSYATDVITDETATLLRDKMKSIVEYYSQK